MFFLTFFNCFCKSFIVISIWRVGVFFGHVFVTHKENLDFVLFFTAFLNCGHHSKGMPYLNPDGQLPAIAARAAARTAPSRPKLPPKTAETAPSSRQSRRSSARPKAHANGQPLEPPELPAEPPKSPQSAARIAEAAQAASRKTNQI